MTTDGRTAAGIVLRPMLAYARSLGVDVGPTLARGHIDESSLTNPDYRIPESTRMRVWCDVVDLVGDPSFGLRVPQHAGVGAYDVLDYTLCYSNTVGDAIDRIVRFHRLLADALAIRVTTTRTTARIQRVFATTHPHEQDAYFALLCLRMRQISGRDVRPREVCFVREAPTSTEEHQKLFECPVRFRRNTLEIVLDASDFALPVLHAKPGLAAVLDRHALEILARLPDGTSYADHARHVVTQALHAGPPTLEAIAKAMHASPRTVQRRLHDAGTSHRQVVDDVRRELAVRYLAMPKLSITEIAFLLGFTDASSFRRAFKGWTGRSPAGARAISH